MCSSMCFFMLCGVDSVVDVMCGLDMWLLVSCVGDYVIGDAMCG